MTGVWHLLQQEVFSKLSQSPHFLIELVDPSSRSVADILEMAGVLKDFEPARRLPLGLNGNEANILGKLHGLATVPAEGTAEITLAQAKALRERLGITWVLIHRIPFVVSADEDGDFMQPGSFCINPKKSTGAGDRFNAGVSLGLALDIPVAGCLALGCAVSGFFVRNARSASRGELAQFLRDRASGSF